MPRIAVVSDLHCHAYGSHKPACSYLISDTPRADPSRHPIEGLSQLVEREPHLKSIDLLVCPGDLSNQIDPQGVFSGWQSLQEIAYILGAPPLIGTIGNHDIDSHHKHECCRDDPLYFGKNLSGRFPSKDSEANSLYWSEGFHSFQTKDLFVLNVNSTHEYNQQPQCKRGGVTQKQRVKIAQHLKSKQIRDQAKILLCHHHPIAHEELNSGNEDLMDQGSLLIEMLIDEGFHLVIHGHKHHARLQDAHSSKGRIPVLASGSFSAVLTGELAQFSKNLFHLVDISSSGLGEVRSWKFRLTEGWTPADWSSSNFPHETGFGFSGNVNTLARDVHAWLIKRENQQSDWLGLVKRFPHVNNLFPGQLQKLRDELAQYEINALPSPPDRPKLLGLLHTPKPGPMS